MDLLTGCCHPAFKLMGFPILSLPGEKNSHWTESGYSYLVRLKAEAGSKFTRKADLITLYACQLVLHQLWIIPAHVLRIKHVVISVLGIQGVVLYSDRALVILENEKGI